MPVFRSYMPLRADFDELVNNHFAHMGLTEEQKKLAEMIFYAGASSAYNVFVNEPLKQGTVHDELADYADRMAREKVS
ncbi:hypothetical protein [Ensifer aridi]|uniref:hypothetical protein n=1 Tax=Ensifer aridi TaxID=1708715 RepID=UPI000A110198|nr:hypothetical protein [Ensifer aridi]